MTLKLETLAFLQSPVGVRLLDDLAGEDLSEARTLPLLTRLRADHAPEQAAVALTMARLRQKAAAKFGDDARAMLFTPDALEQASDPAVRRYRAASFAGQRVIDAGCGIGADSLALARAGAHVLGLDIDPVRIAVAQHNAAVLGLGDRAHFAVLDIRAGLPAGYDAVFFDPARRDAAGNRLYDVEQYIPPLSLIRQWDHGRIVVKLSPGVDLAQIAGYGGMVEFISVRGELKEAVLHVAQSESDQIPRATLIDDTAIHHFQRAGDATEPDVSLSAPLNWLLEPDPTILRAGLVRDLAIILGAAQLDPNIAYLTADTRPASPWVRSWHILDWMPYHLKKLRAALREQGVNRVTVKKRGFPMTPEDLIARLKLPKPKKGPAQTRTLVATRHDGGPVILICDDYAPT